MRVELWSDGYSPIFSAFLVSALVAWLLVASTRWHLRHTDDHQAHLPQKIHRGAVPRVGGVAIAIGVVAGGFMALRGFGQEMVGPQALGVLMGAVPVFVVGLTEDICKKITPRLRLIWAALGALIAIQFAGVTLLSTHVPAIDAVFSIYGVAIAFTVVAIVGSANAFNIIDGLNGLLGGIVLITMAGIAAVAGQVGDQKLVLLAAIIAAATLGFMLFNWPRARLFAGDGGAYFLGFSVAALLLLLIARNPTVSPWFGLTAAALPVCETLVSMWRRFRQRVSTTEPDVGHLHQLIREWLLRRRMLRALRVVRALRALPGVERRRHNRDFRAPNGSASPWLWALHALPVALGALAWNDTPTQVLLLAAFVAAYLAISRRLVRFSRHRSLILYHPETGAVLRSRKESCAPAPVKQRQAVRQPIPAPQGSPGSKSTPAPQAMPSAHAPARPLPSSPPPQRQRSRAMKWRSTGGS